MGPDGSRRWESVTTEPRSRGVLQVNDLVPLSPGRPRGGRISIAKRIAASSRSSTDRRAQSPTLCNISGPLL